jgi:hypothetical protein
MLAMSACLLVPTQAWLASAHWFAHCGARDAGSTSSTPAQPKSSAGNNAQSNRGNLVLFMATSRNSRKYYAGDSAAGRCLKSFA